MSTSYRIVPHGIIHDAIRRVNGESTVLHRNRRTLGIPGEFNARGRDEIRKWEDQRWQRLDAKPDAANGWSAADGPRAGSLSTWPMLIQLPTAN
jgi:hypothetical protein